jgi:xanthine/CO dehydrogenase XdhC/CoxF family maturation factor
MGRRLFLNVYVPPPRIAVIGAVHISQALARMAEVAGFDLRIIDPAHGLRHEERFEGIDLRRLAGGRAEGCAARCLYGAGGGDA